MIAELISGLVGPLLGQGGVLDQSIYTKDEKAENLIGQTNANANYVAAQAQLAAAESLAARNKETLILIGYGFGGLIVLLLLVWLLKTAIKG